MNYVNLGIMCSFLMGLSLSNVEAMEPEGDVLSLSSSEERLLIGACTHYTPEPQKHYLNSSSQGYSQELFRQNTQGSQKFLSGSGPYSQGSSYDSQSSQGTLPCATTIYSFKILKEDIKRLVDKENIPPKNLCVILDFHGVWVNQQSHKLPLTLKEGIIEILDYLQEKKVPYLVATAWDNFNEVIRDGSDVIDLQKYCNVTPNQVAESKKYFLGPYKKTELEGYRNGNVVALRYPLTEEETQKEQAKEEHFYYEQKAFGPELVFPQNKITHLFFVDDSQYNFEVFRQDLPNTSGAPFENLYLYHLSKIF